MQIKKVEVLPAELDLKNPIHIAEQSPISSITAVFLRFEATHGQSAWGCTVAHPALTGDDPADVIKACFECASAVPDLHPFNVAYSLSQLEGLVGEIPTALCAFDLAFHDLLGLASTFPLYRLLGGYRNRIPTSVTIPLGSVDEGVEIARKWVKQGFRLLKIKGGLDPDEDVQRVKAISRTFPNTILRLDADGGYNPQVALQVSRVLEGKLEMIEQPTSPDDLDGLYQVTRHSLVPVLVDQSVKEPASALKLAADRCAHGLSIKLATCGGLQCARQIDAIARAAQMSVMVGCVIEPALLISAGLHYALSSPNVRYADLDGHLNLVDDPTRAGFRLEDGCLIASDVPGLGCTVDL